MAGRVHDLEMAVAVPAPDSLSHVSDVVVPTGPLFDAAFFVESALVDGTHACDYLLTVDMEMEPVEGHRYANWEKGYGDFHLVPDLDTLRPAGWTDRTAFVLCDVIDDATHQLVDVAPRSMLRRQIDGAL